MPKTKLYREQELASIAKEARIKTGKTMAEVSRMLQVSRSVIFNAENRPSKSLTKLRIRMIEELGTGSVKGPFFRIEWIEVRNP